ncbi:7159_t:CDS:1, partial [Entrophospora sp. SA101]
NHRFNTRSQRTTNWSWYSLAAWSLMFLAMAAILILYNYYKKDNGGVGDTNSNKNNNRNINTNTIGTFEDFRNSIAWG